MRKTFLAALLFVCCLLVALLVACNDKKPSGGGDDTPHVCAHVCEICGKCESDCTDPVCADKCGGHVEVPPEEQEFVKVAVKGTDKFMFDTMAGYGQVSGGASYSSTPETGNMVCGFTYKNNAEIEFHVWAAEECEADVGISVRMTSKLVTFTSVTSVLLDGEALESDAQVPVSYKGANADFYEVNLGSYNLVQGNNTFVIAAQDTIDNFDIRGMVFYTDGVELDWTEAATNGKFFSGIDTGKTTFEEEEYEHVALTGGYAKDEVQNTIRVTAYTPSTATFTFFASRKARAQLKLVTNSMQINNQLSTYYDFTVNGSAIATTAKTALSSVMWANYKVIDLANVMLNQGMNTIVISTRDPIDWQWAYNIRGIFIETDAVVDYDLVDYDNTHVCFDECDLCGKCMTDCEELECEEKCECVDETFSGLDEKVGISGGIVKNSELGYVQVVDYGAFDILTFAINTDKAGTVDLYFKTSYNATDTWVFVDYFRVWINDEGARYADGTYQGNRLDKTVYTATSNYGDFGLPFAEVKIGAVELLAGYNEIALGWTCVGNAAFAFHVESMRLRSSELESMTLVALADAHACESACVVCGKCRDEDCDEFICRTKCECVETELSAVDEKVDVVGGTKNESASYVTASADEFNLITFTVSVTEAKSYELLLNIGGTQTAVNPRDYFRVWVNDLRAREADADYVGNKLTGDNGGIKTVVADDTVFGYVTVGAVSLNAGENEIVLGYVGGTGAINVRGIMLRGDETVTLQTTASYSHDCSHVCVVCGKCQDDDCDNAACAEKCECEKLTISALDVNVTKSAGLALNTTVNYVYATGYAFTYLVFDIHTEAAGEALMSFEIGGNPTEPATWAFVGFFRVWINDPNLDLDTVDASYMGNKLSETDYPERTKYAQWEDFSEITIGKVELAAGDNRIVLGWASVDLIAAYGVDAKFNVRNMSLFSSTGAELIELAPHECVHVCPVCEKCTTDCDNAVCAQKCECVKYTFNAIDEQVAKSSTLLQNTEFVFNGFNNVFAYVAFNIHADKAGKAVISFNVGGNPAATWTFVDCFRVWINDPDIDLDTLDGSYIGNKLSKDVYTAQTVQGAADTFGEIVLGAVDLQAGDNQIVLGWNIVDIPGGTSAFYIKDMSLKSDMQLAYATQA